VLIVSLGMIAAYLFGGRLYILAQTRLDSCQDGRDILNDFVHDVRTACDFDIGSGTDTGFTPVAAGQLRQGNALQIYPAAGTNSYIRYFLDTNAHAFKVIASGVSNVIVLAAEVTNTLAFTCEEFNGTITTNEQTAELVGLLLQVSPTAIRQSTTAAGNLKQFYQLSTRVNKRTVLGFQN
jgi:hypothetical protein